MPQSPAGHLLTGGKPGAAEQDFWAKAAWNTLGSPMKMTHSLGVGVFFGRGLVGSWLLNQSLGTGAVKRLGIFTA